MAFARCKKKYGSEDDMRNRYYILAVAACMVSVAARGQSNRYVREGNQLYQQQKYKEAAADYPKALTKDPGYVPGMFNLGNSLYQQKQFDAARKVLAATAKTTKDKGGKAGANYNIGNTYMQEQKWQDAVDAYKQALRNNPQDADAKYNLSYALEMMKKNQGGGGKNNDKNKDNKKDKDKQDKDKQDKNKQDKDKQDRQNKDQQNKDQQDKNKDQQDKDQQHPEPQSSKLSQQQADQLLNALQQEEKKLQDKMQKSKGVPVKMEKDW